MPDRELATDVLHRLTNHLSIILGFADLALESPTIDASARGDVLEIRKAAEAALSEVKKLHVAGREGANP